jgi:hypothetical protein
MSIQLAPETRFQCRHVFTDGRRCGSPALRAQSFCYYHHTTRKPVPLHEVQRRRQFADVANAELPPHQQSGFSLPPAADLTERSGIQLTIGLVLARIATNDLDPRRAGLLLYGLQIASMNLPKQDPTAEPAETVEDITEDPIHGPIANPAEYVPKPTFDFASLLGGVDEDDEEEEEEQEEEEDFADDPGQPQHEPSDSEADPDPDPEATDFQSKLAAARSLNLTAAADTYANRRYRTVPSASPGPTKRIPIRSITLIDSGSRGYVCALTLRTPGRASSIAASAPAASTAYPRRWYAGSVE